MLPPPPSSVGSPGGLDPRRRSTVARTPSMGVPGFGEVPPLPTATSASVNLDWVVKPDEKVSADQFFEKLDPGKKEYLTGEECYSFFLQSQLDQQTLAKVWYVFYFSISISLRHESISQCLTVFISDLGTWSTFKKMGN
jgi:hypothetical protein